MIPSEILSKWCIVCTSYKWLSSIFLEMSNKIPLKTHVFVYASNSKVGMVIDSCHLRRKHIFLSCLIAGKSRTLSPQIDNKQPFSRLQWTANITTLKMEVTECSKILYQNTGYNLSAHKEKKKAKLTPSVASRIHQNLIMPVFPNAYKRNFLQELRKLFKMAVLLRDSSLSPSSSLQFFPFPRLAIVTITANFLEVFSSPFHPI